MSIVVHKNEPIEDALRRLHSEAVRENVFEAANENRYYIKDSEKRSEQRRKWKKKKKRGRRAARKKRLKGG